MLNVGDKAPEFTGQTQAGETISLKDFSGKTVVLYFYPKDDTPGCTKEACSLRDHHAVLASENVVVIGISSDSVQSHKKFADKFSLPFFLLADPDTSVIQAYGAWGAKKMYGKVYDGILRITYIIGADGTVRHIFTKVNTAIHAEEVLAALHA